MPAMRLGLGRCGFCGAAAARGLPLAGNPERPARICLKCVASFLPSPGEVAAARRRSEAGAGSLAALEAEVERAPTDVRARLRLGDAYCERGANQKAIHEYRLVAAAYVRDGFALEAVAVYKTILRLEESAEIRSLLGELYEALGLRSDAVAQYSAAITRLTERGEAERSLPLLRKLLALEPKDLLVRERIAQLEPADRENLFWLASHYLATGDPRRALSRLQFCFRATPRAPRVLALLARVFGALGLKEKEAHALTELALVRAGPASGADAVAAASALPLPPSDASDEPTEPVSARAVVDEFLAAVDRQIGGNAGARYDLGIALEEMGLFDEAIAELERAAEDPALAANALGLMGLCHGRAGRYARAIEAYSSAIRTPDLGDRQKAQFFFELAEMLVAQGDEGKARQAFTQAVTLDPATPREYPGKSSLHLRGAREAFAGGGSRDAYAPYDDEADREELASDRNALERILRADPDDATTRAALVSLLLDEDSAAEARAHLEILLDHYRDDGDELRVQACEARLARIAESDAPVGLIRVTCSFCDALTNVRVPPARGREEVICCDCLRAARAVLEHG